ncbi:50S ribosomal protein L23 [Candidatus Peregrinibacteria bacterium]|nr:50S ribosomal protein L23 [Candidatus Peregrinibacteria bacterium]
MDLSHVILGPIVTEKAERLKADADNRTYSMRVSAEANKIDIKNALKKFYDLDVRSVRVMWVRPKATPFGRGQLREKRHAYKKALVTASEKSKALDLASFKTT